MMNESQRNKYVCSYSADYRSLYDKRKCGTRCISASIYPIVKRNEGIYTDISLDSINKEKNNPEFKECDYKTYERKNTTHSGLLNVLLRTSLISVILVLCISCLGAVSHFFCEGQASERLRYYDSVIWPVVMQDPEPFDEKHMPNLRMILNAAIWKSAVQNEGEACEYDNMGRLILSQAKVEQSVKELFGKNIDIKSAISDDVYFYKYDQAQSRFYVEAVSGEQFFSPRTVSFRNEGTAVVLDVEYIVPQQQFDGLSEGINDLKAEKYMQYIIKKDPQPNKEYISEIKASV